MNRRLRESHVRAVTASLSAIAGIAAIVGLLTWPLPISAGTLVLAGGLGYWAFRNERPSLQDIVSVAAIAMATAAGIAWLGTRGGENSYDFIVVPKQVYALESAFPGPGHEIGTALEYGEHVQVACLIEGEDSHDWAELNSGYFLPASELAAAPRSHDSPPRC
jgi:hypothetical protein